MFIRGFVVTGYVDLSIARPDISSTKEHMSGHGWTMVELVDSYRRIGRANNRWLVVECTTPFVPHSIPAGVELAGINHKHALASIDPAMKKEILEHPDIDKRDKKAALDLLVRQTPSWIAGACASLYGDALMLVRNTILDGIGGGIGPAHLMDVDKNGIPFKYRTVATLSDSFDSYAVTTHVAVKPVHVDGGDGPSTVQYARRTKLWKHSDPLPRSLKERATHEGEHPLPPPGMGTVEHLDGTDKVEVCVSLPEFMANKFDVRRVTTPTSSVAYDIYFRPFMINPFLSSTQPNLKRFIERDGGLHERRFEGARFVDNTSTSNNQFPPSNQLVLPDTWIKTPMMVEQLPTVCVTVVPAVVYNTELAGSFVAEGINPLFYHLMRFTFGDMIAFGLDSIPLLANTKPAIEKVSYRRQNGDGGDDGGDTLSSSPRARENHVVSVLKQHHPGYKRMIVSREE